MTGLNNETNMHSLKSMTAYARHAQTLNDKQYIWELRSVNHRYLDAHFRLPETAHQAEPLIRKQLAQKVSRGRIDISLSIKEAVNEKQNLTLSRETLDQWLQWQQQILDVIADAKPLSVMEILNDKNIFEHNESVDAIDADLLMESFQTALDGLLSQRAAEGGRLQLVLNEKLDQIADIALLLKQNMPDYEKAHQLNWQARVKKLHQDVLDPIRLNQELALLISKADVTEELDRLDSHVAEFSAALSSGKAVGRRLDFLLQEFNREANTLGSKSIHQAITNASVELKVLIDQLREQVQNIE